MDEGICRLPSLRSPSSSDRSNVLGSDTVVNGTAIDDGVDNIESAMVLIMVRLLVSERRWVS